MPTIWLPLLSMAVVVLVATSLAERPIKRVIRTRFPAFDFDGQAMLAWGVAGLGALTMTIFFVLVLLHG